MDERMKNSLIKIKDFTFSIGEKKILDSVSLTIGEGDYLSIIGPNGAGKTTLLKCIIRIFTGGKGTIIINGKSIHLYKQKELARLMAYVPQGGGFSVPFTVMEFVMLGRYPHLSPFTLIHQMDRIAVSDALDLTGTSHLAHRYMTTLSGGERQSVYVASALAQGARLLLLDEPTTFLDPKHQSNILNVMKRCNRELGITIVSVTHDINAAVLESDQIIILKNGKVFFTGNAPDVMNNDLLETVYEKKFIFMKHPNISKLIIIPEVRDS
jgi:iron complex transport system ATP-binding protein